MAKKIIKRLPGAKPPKLFKRGSAGIFHFRLRMNGKDKWFSTKTNDPEKAKGIAISIAEGKMGAAAVAKTEKTAVGIARKLSSSIVQSITGQNVPSLKIDEAQAKWVSLFQRHGDLTPTTRNFYGSVFKRFAEWCKEKGLSGVDEISETVAIEYAKELWENGLAPKTFNEHIAHLSRVFSKLDRLCPLPHRNPFDKDKVERIEKAELETASHKPIEADKVEALIQEASKHGSESLSSGIRPAHD